MAITAGDIKIYFSQNGGEDYNGSLGGAIGTTEITDGALRNLFDNVQGSEALAGDTEYRCIYIKNDHGTDTWYEVKLWIYIQAIGPDNIEVGLGTSGKNGTEQTIADEDTAPSAVSFSAPSTKGTGLDLGDLDAGDYYPVWISRIVPVASASYVNDYFVLEIDGSLI